MKRALGAAGPLKRMLKNPLFAQNVVVFLI